MSNLSALSRAIFVLVMVIGFAGFLVIVDFGIHAGVVHRGVTVRGFDVGGLTLEETQAALNEHRSTLRAGRVCFVRDDFKDCIFPADVGWFPSEDAIERTARNAYAVGRRDGPLVAVGERMRSWMRGTNVGWARFPRSGLVSRQLDAWEEELEHRGYTLDRARMRAKLRRAVVMWPRRDLRFPVER